MKAAEQCFAGIDVGGRKKGFHLAVIQGQEVVELGQYRDVGELVAELVELGPGAVGIDSPPEWAPDGEKSRPAEREFARQKICGIRYTPDRATAEAHAGSYYEWVFNGMELWEGLVKGPTRYLKCTSLNGSSRSGKSTSSCSRPGH